MERGQGPSRRGPPDSHRVGPFCRIGVRVNAEPMRLEKSETPLASPARYAAHAPASARLLAQAGRPREPCTARAAAARARRGPVVRERVISTGILGACASCIQSDSLDLSERAELRF